MMIKQHIVRTLISTGLYFSICFGAIWLINPQSLVNFVGPAAALISGLLLIWGIIPMVAVILVSPILAYSLDFYFHLDTNLAVMAIAVLAIALQGFWTKQLVFRFVRNKQWLISRKCLFIFLLRIGPIASLVSASAVLIISMLENQVLEGTFLFTFINTWSTSMLVAVFLIPLLLLINNAEKFKLTKRFFVGFTSLLGALAIFLLIKTFHYEQQQHRQALFQQSKVEIERVVRAEVNRVVNKANSLSALFIASKYVSLTEFTLFSESILQQNSSVRAVEWAPVIPFAQRQKFEQNSSQLLQKEFYIKERLANGSVALAQPRTDYAPLYYIYPQFNNESVLGLDVYSNPAHLLSMSAVVDSKTVIASAPMTLLQDDLAKPSILFTKAIFTLSNNNIFVDNNNLQSSPLMSEPKLLGFVIVVAQFERFFTRLAQQNEKKVNFFIEDVSSNQPFIFFGQQFPTVNRQIDTMTIEVASRFWKISIAEKHAWFNQAKNWQTWAVLIGGTFGAVLFQMLILMMAAYSSELGQQVNNKTRALILAKESSDQKSLAKSNFLYTLNKELRVPLLAMKAFVEQLNDKGINNTEITGIGHAGNNVAILLDTMMDLSNIESGKVIAKTDCFDFFGFLQRTESIVKASNTHEGRSIFVLIDESVPHYINSDELYIQKLLSSLIESAHHLLKTNALRLSIKLHKHKLAEASLFFTLSSQNPPTYDTNTQELNTQDNEQFTVDSTSLAMAIKYSQLLHGDTSLGALSSGEGVLNSSIRITISSSEQQEAQQGLIFDLIT